MEAICNMLEHYRQYMDDFTAKKYPDAFARFSQAATPYFAALEGTDVRMAAAALLDARGKVWEAQKRSWSRGQKRDGEKLMMVTYLIPAAMAAGREDFAKALTEEWQRRYGGETLGIGTYEDMMEGFRQSLSSILGFRRI